MILIQVAQYQIIHYITQYIILVHRDDLFDISYAQVIFIQVAQHQTIYFLTRNKIMIYENDLLDI